MNRRQPAALALPILAGLVLIACMLWVPQAGAAGPVASHPQVAPASATPGARGGSSPAPTPAPGQIATQNAMVLAQTYLEAGNAEDAAQLFAGVLEQDPNNAQALSGLRAALDAARPATGLLPTTGAKWNDYASTALAGLLVFMLLYMLAQGLRWLFFWLREFWLMRVLPLAGLPARKPGFMIEDFTDATGLKGFPGSQVVTQALTEKLLAWNQLVNTKEVTVEPSPLLNLAGLDWVKVLWNLILPPPRGFRVRGTLLTDGSAHRLSVQRISRARNVVDSGQTFESSGGDAERVYRAMASEAAKWLLIPRDMAAGAAAARGVRAVQAPAQPSTPWPTTSQVFDQALDLLLPVQQQVSQGAVDQPYARSRIQEAQALVEQLPPQSDLRHELQGVLRHLRRALPPAQSQLPRASTSG